MLNNAHRVAPTYLEPSTPPVRLTFDLTRCPGGVAGWDPFLYRFGEHWQSRLGRVRALLVATALATRALEARTMSIGADLDRPRLNLRHVRMSERKPQLASREYG